MSDYWSGKRILCTGSSGFLGRPLCEVLRNRGASVITGTNVFKGSRVDLRDPFTANHFFSKAAGFDIAFHLAADVGGIADNISRPAEIFYNNVMINTNVVAMAQKHGVKKLIALGSSCAYPSDAPLPLREEDYLKGEPEPTNAPYAYSKRLLLSHLQAAHTQYGLDYTYLILANLYGEGCETDPQKAHVIGALVRKFYEAKRDGLPSVTLWGTGKATRDFLHVDDAVEALLHTGEHEYNDAVLNIGTGYGFDIGILAGLIADCTGYTGRIGFDADRPDGQAKRVLGPQRGNTLLEWEAHIPFTEGIARIVAWYAFTQKELAPA